jgi:hexosaminidase
MKIKFFILTIVAFCFSFVNAQSVNIVPKPKSFTFTRSLPFEFSQKTKIYASDETGRKTAGILNDLMLQNYGFKLEFVQKQPSKNVILIEPQTLPNGERNAESYTLNVTDKAIRINGTEIGQFYALQSLMQLLPVEFKGKTKVAGMEIIDEPRFKYRGMHLDVGRHFMPVTFVKKYIDLMSQYKFNYFHWHLTEDQGWRIEIKKYPKLTEIGSKRRETMLEKNFSPYVGDGIPVDGFYTQEQIKEVVAYAKARKVTTIPEIELPGHSSAALAAYPELGCKQNYNYSVQTTWGIFKEVYCPTETTFKFLEDVLTETIALFPDSPYIHIGGDEVLKDHWKESPEVQALMKRENLKDEHEVQSYFIRRMEKFINSKGKKIIGWDEILEGGLAPNATVMSWRGTKGGIAAAKAKHDVIMTPTDFCYLDYGQGDPQTEPLNIGNHLTIEKIYSSNPMPKELTEDEQKYILGVQGNVWTEYMKTPEKVEYMVFPRALALAEVAWSPQDTKDFKDFNNRLGYQFERLDKQNVNYRIPEPEGLTNVVLTDGFAVKIALEPYSDKAKIIYTTDKNDPNSLSPTYNSPIEIAFDKLSDQVFRQVRAVVVNPKGRKSSVYAATVLRREIVESVEPNDNRPGVFYTFFKGSFASVKEIDKMNPPTGTGETKSIQLPQFKPVTNDLKEPFGVIFDGYIYAPEDAIYEFNLEADDGAILLIGKEEAVVGLDKSQAKVSENGVIPLKKGFHKLRLKYFQTGESAVLNLRWGIKGQGLRRIYGNELVH